MIYAIVLMVLIAVSQVADILSTNYALKHGFMEINPLMAADQKYLKGFWWVPKSMLALVMGVLGLTVALKWPLGGFGVLVATLVAGSVAPVSNLILLLRKAHAK